MTVSTTTRLGITRWDAGGDAFTRSDMDDSHANLEARAAGYSQAASRPTAAAAYAGFFHFSATGILTYCDGVQWHDLITPGSAVVDLDDTSGVVGAATTFARSDHRHGISDDAITTGMIQDNAVTTAKITNNNVTLAKLVDSAAGYAVLGKTGTGSGDFAEISAGANSVLRRAASGNLEFGTLSTAHIGDGQITTDKIGNQQVTLAKMADNSVGSAQYIDGSIQAIHFAPNAVSGASVDDDSIDSQHYVDGSIDTDHIGNNQVTVAKIQQVGAHSILARLGSTAANLSELAAGSNGVLRRVGTGNLEFGALSDFHINDNAITNAKLADMGAHTVKIRQTSTGNPQDLTVGVNQVVGRGSGTVTSTQVQRDMIANDAIDGSKIANAVINSEHYVNNSIDGGHLNTNLYSSGTWQGALSGNAATATRLQNARTIGGVTFDGTTSINLPGVNAAGNQNTSGNAQTATNATNVYTLPTSANANYYVAFVDAIATAAHKHNRVDGNLLYNPNSNTLTTTNFVGTTFTASGNIISNNIVKCDSFQWNSNGGGTGHNKFLDSGGTTLMGLWESGGLTHLEITRGLPTLSGMLDVGIVSGSKQIGAFSSSERFKHSIEPATSEQLNNIIDGLEVDFFRWNDDILESSGRPLDSEPELGMIAEKVGAAFSCAAINDENDIPLGWQNAPVVSLCVGLLKEHKDKLAAMETRLAALEV